VESLLFYHPVVWWISGVIRAEREHCCDDLAVALSGDAHQYAVALAALEQCRWDASETALAATGGNLVKRIRRLLIPTEGPSSALTPFVSAGILMITLAVGLTAWQEKAQPSPFPVPEQRFLAQNSTAQAEPGQDALRRLQEQLDRLVGQLPATAGVESLIQRLHRVEALQPVPGVSSYTKWLEEDVVYIIQPEERDAFQRLETDGERDEFINQFWQRRDPTPGTPENEFKDEHYRRIAYANLHFPTATGKAGWKTDRGRIYIRFGPPDEIDDHSTGDAAAAVPYVDWTYRSIQSSDINATNVKVEFVDPTGTHDFKMTSDPHPPAK
jgi:GWxTD domain-containing protein